jgi:hypothetical protein
MATRGVVGVRAPMMRRVVRRREGGAWPTVGPGRGVARSSSMGAGERRERGGGLIWGNGRWAGPCRKKKKWAWPKVTVPLSN